MKTESSAVHLLIQRVTYHVSSVKSSKDALPISLLNEEETKNPPKAELQRPKRQLQYQVQHTANGFPASH